MKYIRTEDENNLIIDMDNMQLPYNLTDEYINFNKFGMFKIIKQADTIEELCDEFVVEDDYYSAIFNNLKLAKQTKGTCYGVIRTEWGLKYVAKVKGVLPNGEIDWELL